RPHGRTPLRRVPRQFIRIDGSDGAIGEGSAGGSAVYLRLVDVDAFFILSCIAGWHLTRCAGSSRIAIAGGCSRSLQIAGIGDVVVDAGQGRASAGDDRGEAGKRV